MISSVDPMRSTLIIEWILWGILNEFKGLGLDYYESVDECFLSPS